MKLVYAWMLLVVLLFCVTLYLAFRVYVFPAPQPFPQNTADWLSLSQLRDLSVEEAREAIANTTIRHFTAPVNECSRVQTATGSEQKCEEIWAGHGTTVEFFRSDGRVFLWYPELEEPIVSTWELRGLPEPQFVCLGYTLRHWDTRKHSYKQQECLTLPQFYRTIEETIGGDPFDLSGGDVPHVLGREKASLQTLWQE